MSFKHSLACSVLLLLELVTVSRAAPVMVTVDANLNSFGCGLASPDVSFTSSLVDTGIDVNVGDSIVITAVGMWRGAGDPTPYYDANGGPGGFANAPELKGASLLGQIGEVPLRACDTGAFGRTFFVGTNFSGTASQSGRLFLAFCDTDFGNNQGSVVATITVTPPPAVCGNQKVEAGEQCDDGNVKSGDGCSATCQTEIPLPQALFRCQQRIGEASRLFLQDVLIAHQACLERQLRGTLALTVDCRSLPSGDRKTDTSDLSAKTALGKRLRETCGTVTLEALGYPGECLDTDGFPFTLTNLQACIEDGVLLNVEDLLNLLFSIP
jgi:cysteine-rich repeat protein